MPTDMHAADTSANRAAQIHAHTKVSSAAPTWVLLRGLTRGAGHWGRFVPALQAAWPGVRVLTPEVAGNGARYRERSPSRIPAMTDDLRAALRADGVRGPVWLLALSMGGMLACDWAQRCPAEVAGMVLINTSLRPFSPLHHRLRPGALLHLLRTAAMRPDAAAWERCVLDLTSRAPAAAADDLARWISLREQQPVHLANALRQLAAAARFSAQGAPPGSPVLVLASAGDALVNPACSHSLAEQWHCPLREHPQAGHDLPLDAPGWLLAQVRAWADGVVDESVGQPVNPPDQQAQLT